VSIALHVYNGERYLAETLDSLLAQTFRDFDLLILDNASTDRTREIARDYERRDQRVRYVRNDVNIGAARNFNRAFELTSGRYFKWAAHDDLLHPTFLERCVTVLEKNVDAVLATAKARIIDEEGMAVTDYDPHLASDAPDAATRFAAMLEEHKCFQVFGVIRRSALEKTDLIGLYAHGDGILLARLALLGRVIELPEYLFLPRRHADHSSRMIGDYWSYATWFNPDLAHKRTFPHCRMFGEYARAVVTAPVPLRDRLGASVELLKVVRARWRLIRGDVLYYVRPTLVAAGVPERFVRRRT
jgi:glycosyltransferase involved in cell wall biosynthesis